MKQTLKRSISFLIAFVMVIGVLATMPFAAFAAGVDYNHNASASSDEYYNLITKTDWDNAPGITESEIVLNNDAGDYRQVVHIMKADVNNSYVNVIPTYNEMNTSKYQTATMLDQANWIDQNMDGEVIGVMNCCLSWYSGYDADRVGEPLGFMMMNGEIMFDPGNCGYEYGNVGFPTCVVINKDFDENGNPRPADIPKVEMPQLRTSADLDGWEDTVIPVSSGYIVKDGVNQNKASHNGPAPRSVVGITADGRVVMMENDGRQLPFSAGMNMYECAEVMIAAGCVWAANCDGGGSSTFVSQRPGEELKVNNSPSDGGLRPSTSGICFISTAPATGEFVRASISTDSAYYTPGSSVQFNAVGTDLVGTLADIPEDAVWQLADPSLGTIDQNGLFASNGTQGTVTAQLVYDGKVVGEATVNVVIPESIAFSQKIYTAPYGKTIELGIVATYGAGTVALKNDDISLSLSDAALGTLDGFSFTACDENASVTGGTIQATLANSELTCSAELILGKGSQVVYDFDEGTEDFFPSVQEGYGLTGDLYSVTEETGKVHSGDGALAMEFDLTNSEFRYTGGWLQGYVGSQWFEVDEGATNIGLWVYLPEIEDLGSLALRLYVEGYNYKTVDVYTINPGDDLGYDGWRYISADISSIGDIYLFLAFYPMINATPEGASKNTKYTFYIDDITVDYSTAVDDREPPVFGDIGVAYDGVDTAVPVKGQVVNANEFSFTVKATEDTAKTNYTGLDIASAKAYIDGVLCTQGVKCTEDGAMSISDITLPNGTHTVRFEMCDNMGNKSYTEGYITVDGTSAADTISIVPSDPNADRLPIGSLYWLDVQATAIEDVQSVTTVIDLNGINTWELEHMEVAPGFSATYSVDTVTNNATITISKTGVSNLTGTAVLAKLPIRTWESDRVKNGEFTPEQIWQNAWLCHMDINLNTDLGMVTFTDGSTSTFSMTPLAVDTELYSNAAGMGEDYSSKTSWHIHTVEALADQAATCTKDGYTDRTFCAVCNSVVDWGTTEETVEHSYAVIDGKLTCVSGGELFNGVYTDGKTYVDGVVANGWLEDTYYFIDGMKVTGQKLIDGTMCTFDENGVYQPNYFYTGFYHDGIGWTYYQANFQTKGFVVIDGNTHYFDDRTGYAPIGFFTLAEDRVYRVEGEQGKVLGGWDTYMVDGVERRRYYYSLRYYKNQWLEVDGDMYYFDNEGYALIGTRAVAFSGEYLGGYEFAMDGKLIAPITGPFVDYESGYKYFAENGEMACNKLVKHGNDYYFARNNYLLITWATYITEEQANGLLPAGEYQFGADGKLQMLNGPVPDAYNANYLTFYKDGIRVYEEGLQEYNGDYYYVRSNGLLLTWGMNITKTNGLLPAGEYKFGEDGKLQMLNGPVEDAYNPAYLNFYRDGIRVYEEGLQEYNGDYYYVRSNGLLLTWGMYITKTNGLLPAGEYKFGEDGKLQMLNGPVEDAYNPAYLNFYKNGVRVYEEGLQEYNGDYYYVRGNGLLITWGTYVSEEKANGLLPAGEYQFGADGKMIQ